MEKLRAAEPRRSSRPDRSSIVHLSLLKRLAIISVLFAGLGEFTQTKKPEHPPSPVQARTVDDLLYQIRSALGDIRIEERRAIPEDEEIPPDPGIAPGTMAGTGLRKLWSTCKKLCSTPSETGGEIADNTQSAGRYILDYRMSEEQAAQANPDGLDCNDHANITCERLSRLGLPVYLLSIWPEDPATRFDAGWHQMAACKVRSKCYLIFDTDNVTLWHGSLEGYVRQYGPNVRMRIIPRVGISAYAEPKYDNFAAKFLVQTVQAIGNEEGMQSLDLPPPRELLRIAQR